MRIRTITVTLILPLACAFLDPAIRMNDRISGLKYINGSSKRRLLSTVDNNNDLSEADENPDLVGVRVDGFPLPPTPVRDNDKELAAAMRRVPIRPLDTPLQPGVITTSRPLRVIIAGGGLGGLALATHLIQKGCDVHVFEQARQYKPFGGT